MTELHDLTAHDLAAAIRSGQVSPTEATQHALDRVAKFDDAVGAFTTVTAERALAQARAAEELIASSKTDDLPTLLGVPCPIKDLNMVAGVPFHAGSAALAEFVAPVDDGIVTLLERAGTIMLGKTSTPEFGMPPYTEPDIGPTARTPWDLTRSAGGSSGGAGAAVAARITPIAQGSDGGGSIRIPASACGLVGLKPSRGRISPGPHGIDGPGLSSLGFLTRDVQDTALLLDIADQHWPGDTMIAPSAAGSFLEASRREPGKLRIGLLTTPVISEGAPIDDDVLRVTNETAALLTQLGHDVVEVPVPFPASGFDAFRAMWAVMALDAPVPPEAEDALVPLTKWLREYGRTVTGLQHAAALSAAQNLTREIAQKWADVDMVLTPTLAQLPALVGSQRNDADPAADFAAQMAFTPWTSIANISGRPSISLPLGSATRAGAELPIGVMFTGNYGREDQLLALSSQLEQTAPWAERRPLGY